jgi:hypothetical protein
VIRKERFVGVMTSTSHSRWAWALERDERSVNLIMKEQEPKALNGLEKGDVQQDHDLFLDFDTRGLIDNTVFEQSLFLPAKLLT